eukprot:scaffold415811_cov59-Attheya_sp.AAC.1
MAKNATAAAWTTGMAAAAAAAGYNSGPFCGEVNESIVVAENMVLGVARDWASSMHGDSGHQ